MLKKVDFNKHRVSRMTLEITWHFLIDLSDEKGPGLNNNIAAPDRNEKTWSFGRNEHHEVQSESFESDSEDEDAHWERHFTAKIRNPRNSKKRIEAVSKVDMEEIVVIAGTSWNDFKSIVADDVCQMFEDIKLSKVSPNNVRNAPVRPHLSMTQIKKRLLFWMLDAPLDSQEGSTGSKL